MISSDACPTAVILNVNVEVEPTGVSGNACVSGEITSVEGWCDSPVSPSVTLPPSESMIAASEKLPGAVGANVVVIVTDALGASVCPEAGMPATVKGAFGSVDVAKVSVEPPTLLKMTDWVTGLPGVVPPKLTSGVLSCITGFGLTPCPDKATAVLPADVAIPIEPDAGPVCCGVNDIATDSVCPAVSVAGNDGVVPVTEKPAPCGVSAVTVRSVFAVSVSVAVVAVPTTEGLNCTDGAFRGWLTGSPYATRWPSRVPT